MKKTSVMALCLLAFALGGCATNTAQIAKKDYSAYRAADPKTILILPPKNTSPDVAASYGFYSNTQAPVAESGYYVLPISLVDGYVVCANNAAITNTVSKAAGKIGRAHV